MRRKALILDRDGVVNHDENFVHRTADFRFMDGIFDLCRAAREDGFLIVIITNQSGIARGMYGHDDLALLHRYMLDRFAQEGILIDAVLYCPHLPGISGECLCRKPGALLFERAAAMFHLDTAQSIALGDKERDLIPARSLGCKTVLVEGHLPRWEEIARGDGESPSSRTA